MPRFHTPLMEPGVRRVYPYGARAGIEDDKGGPLFRPLRPDSLRAER